MKVFTYLYGIVAATFVQCKLEQVADWTTPQEYIERTMFVHKGAKDVPSKAPIIVMIHPCLFTAQAYYDLTTIYQRAADDQGIHLIYPQTHRDNKCWDVATKESLEHNGGSDSKIIVSMVQNLVKKGADPSRVYAIGTSSGAMMTNVLMATYPDVFKAGAAFSGVPYDCLRQPNCKLTNKRSSSPITLDQGCSSPMTDKSSCVKAPTTRAKALGGRSAEQWGEKVRQAFPNYKGARPKVMIWHGDNDSIVNYVNLGDALKEWSNVLDVTFTRNQTLPVRSGGHAYTKIIYGDGTKLAGFSAKGVGHTVPAGDALNQPEVFKFFGLDKATRSEVGKNLPEQE